MFDVGQAGEVPAKSCPQPFDGEVPAKSLRKFGGKKQWRSSRHNIFRRSSFISTSCSCLPLACLFIGYHTPSILPKGQERRQGHFGQSRNNQTTTADEMQEQHHSL